MNTTPVPPLRLSKGGSWVLGGYAYDNTDVPGYPRVSVQDCASHPADIDVEKSWDIQGCGECDPSGVVTVRNIRVQHPQIIAWCYLWFACSVSISARKCVHSNNDV